MSTNLDLHPESSCWKFLAHSGFDFLGFMLLNVEAKVPFYSCLQQEKMKKNEIAQKKLQVKCQVWRPSMLNGDEGGDHHCCLSSQQSGLIHLSKKKDIIIVSIYKWTLCLRCITCKLE